MISIAIYHCLLIYLELRLKNKRIFVFIVSEYETSLINCTNKKNFKSFI